MRNEKRSCRNSDMLPFFIFQVLPEMIELRSLNVQTQTEEKSRKECLTDISSLDIIYIEGRYIEA